MLRSAASALAWAGAITCMRTVASVLSGRSVAVSTLAALEARDAGLEGRDEGRGEGGLEEPEVEWPVED